MTLTRNVGKAAFIQFGFISLMSIPSSLNNIITTCHDDGLECVSNTLVTLVLYVLIVGFFGAIAALAYAAEEKRKKIFALSLIFVECVVAFAAYINARGHTDFLSLFTSVVDIILAVWIIALAVRIIHKGKRRIVSKQRIRKRKTPTVN